MEHMGTTLAGRFAWAALVMLVLFAVASPVAGAGGARVYVHIGGSGIGGMCNGAVDVRCTCPWGHSGDLCEDGRRCQAWVNQVCVL